MKPVYTKEMHERGEWPPVGSEIVIRYKFDSKSVTHQGAVLFLSDRNIILDKSGKDVHFNACDYIVEPIPTIEDELTEIIKHNRLFHDRYIAEMILKKFNVTPKDS